MWLLDIYRNLRTRSCVCVRSAGVKSPSLIYNQTLLIGNTAPDLVQQLLLCFSLH